MGDWSNFFVATAGAAAALTGLIFVGISINLEKILSISSLPPRALVSLALLMTILILSMLFLIPKHSHIVLGSEILLIGIAVWLTTIKVDIDALRNKDNLFKRFSFYNLLFNQVAIFPYLIGGIVILTSGESGFYCIVMGMIVSFFKAVSDAWVLLIEINR